MTITLDESVGTRLTEMAASSGFANPSAFLEANLDRLAAKPPKLVLKPKPTDEEIRLANERLMRHIQPGLCPGGTDNESIDRDLAKAYGDIGEDP